MTANCALLQAIGLSLGLLSVSAAASELPPPETGERRLFELGDSNSVAMVFIAPGEFVMGSPASEPERNPEREAQRPVRITEGFWLAETEMTQTQYAALTGSRPSRHTGPDLPVEQVSFEDVEALLAVLNRARGRFRLPTEAEWEYACRTGTKGPYPSPRDEITWHRENSGGEPHPVGSKDANPWGLYDMNGNVGELVSDWLAPAVGGDELLVDPQGPSTGAYKVLRGGQFTGRTRHTRCADRQRSGPADRDFFVGFRLLRELD